MAIFSNIDSQAGQPKHISVGQVLGLSVSGAMTGYVDGAALSISAPVAGGVQASGTIHVTAGAITGFTITNPGAGYVAIPTVTAPTGTGATIVAVVAANAENNSEIVFVSTEEAVLSSNRAKGIRSPGWYKVVQKMNSDGSITYKTENLVSMASTNTVSGDVKGDDLVIGDVVVAITMQPANLSVTAPAAAVLSVVATGVSTYQWQIQTGGIGAYTNLAATGVYAGGVTAPTLNITNSSGLNKNRYRVVCTEASGAAQVTSRGALLTVA